MTVQSLGLPLLESHSGFWDELLNWNVEQYPGLQLQKDRGVVEECKSPLKSVVNSPAPKQLESPDMDVEDAYNFENSDEKPSFDRPLSSSLVPTPFCPTSGISQIVTTGEQFYPVATSPGTSRPSLVTSVLPMATRLRTGTQLRRTVRSPDSLSGSSSSSPRYMDDGEKLHLDELPEMKFKKGKRKKDVNLEAIDDPDERRKQRRLAKNRATAALSRQRKRDQMAMLIERVRAMDAANASLKVEIARLQQENVMKDKENTRLRGELASHTSGVGGATESEMSALGCEPAALSGAGPECMMPVTSGGVEGCEGIGFDECFYFL